MKLKLGTDAREAVENMILVTGSARLDFYGFGGDSLQGRYHYLRLHPFSVAELEIRTRQDFTKLLELGGFPEPFLRGSAVEARRWSRELGFEAIAELAQLFLVFAGKVIIGLIITMIGVYLANLAAKTIQASKAAQAHLLATAARIAIIGLAASMALGHLGLAENIINLAFGILLGSLAVGAALAFGLGGREAAARKLEEWLRKGRSRRA